MFFNGIPIWAAGTLAVTLISAIAGLHFLHRRYRRVNVPTLLFWNRICETQRRNRLWGRLNHLWTLLLLVAIGLLMTAGLLRPTLVWGHREPMRHVLIVDCRQSMSLPAADGTGTRLDAARNAAKQTVRSIPEIDEIVIVAVGDTARYVSGMTVSQAGHIRSLAGLNHVQGACSEAMVQAMYLAEAVTSPTRKTRMKIFTDHPVPFSHLTTTTLLPDIYVVGQPVANLALLDIEVTAQADGQAQLSVAAGYWGVLPMEAKLELYRNQELIAKKSVAVEPGRIEQFHFYAAYADLHRLWVRAVCDDALELDNTLALRDCPGLAVYADTDIPGPLTVYLDAEQTLWKAESIERADVIFRRVSHPSQINHAGVFVIHSDGSMDATIERLVLTDHLYQSSERRIGAGTDLFAFVGKGLYGLPETAQPLLITDTGTVIAAVMHSEAFAAILLDETVFSKDSPFWKAPQFPELIGRFIALAAEGTEGLGARRPYRCSVYADLWNMDRSYQASGFSPTAGSFGLYRWLMTALLGLLLVDVVLWYKRKIV